MATKKKPKGGFMSSGEMIKQGSKLPAAAKDMAGFAAFEFDADDFKIPRVSGMVGTSKLVQDGDAKPGEFRAANGELLGTIDKPFEFIPFHAEKLFYVHKDDNGKRGEFMRTEPYDSTKPINERDITSGQNIVRYKSYKIYFILAEHAKSGQAFPYFMSLGSTSGKGAAQEIVMQMYMKNAAFGGNPAAFAFTMSGAWVEKSGQAKFISYKARPSRKSTEDEIKAAVEWASMVASGKAKAQEETEEG